MSIEYTVKLNVCSCCGRAEKEIDIGLASNGIFYKTTDFSCLNNKKNWLENLKENDKIVDEYGKEISVKEMFEIIGD